LAGKRQQEDVIISGDWAAVEAAFAKGWADLCRQYNWKAGPAKGRTRVQRGIRAAARDLGVNERTIYKYLRAAPGVEPSPRLIAALTGIAPAEQARIWAAGMASSAPVRALLDGLRSSMEMVRAGNRANRVLRRRKA
jgi:hypothetical protein